MKVKVNRAGRKQRQAQVLHDFGFSQEAPPLERECAEYTGELVDDALFRLRQRKALGFEGRYSQLKIAVESLSGGANTVLFDDLGFPSIVVGLPKMRICDLYGGENPSIHPAWVVDGTIKETLYVSKYMNTVYNRRAYSLPMQDPHTYFTFEDANWFCLNKGKGWHLMTNAAWAAIAAWCKRNGTIPRGNTGWGFAHQAPYEKGVPAAMNGRDVLRTMSGSGPVTWNHNHNISGIADLVGNMFEWVGGLRLMDGEIQMIPEGTAAMYSPEAFRKDSRRWRGITAGGELSAHGELDTLKVDSLVPGDAEERDHLIGAPVISTELRNRAYTGSNLDGNQAYVECSFSRLQAEKGLNVPKILEYLGVFPGVSPGVFPGENATSEDGIFVARNYGERIAVRGGKGGSFERGGIYALHFYNPRTYDGSATIGFRSAFME